VNSRRTGRATPRGIHVARRFPRSTSGPSRTWTHAFEGPTGCRDGRFTGQAHHRTDLAQNASGGLAGQVPFRRLVSISCPRSQSRSTHGRQRVEARSGGCSTPTAMRVGIWSRNALNARDQYELTLLLNVSNWQLHNVPVRDNSADSCAAMRHFELLNTNARPRRVASCLRQPTDVRRHPTGTARRASAALALGLLEQCVGRRTQRHGMSTYALS
jgi:hypothetical protein